ncbi:hypothetical protein DICPUDRAFT_78657 [Dictyostelium purpureum]|uniref:Sacsin/Nov domain-containing protein n=1 Tax=Dictyostelium purpureum TaxID=5786 RepID=F0ZK60_DICPU|nr:uncharacterized protein DICPUDRAFT_78657 [Dictyostelium purpureum]EGC35676.1 hypothetical protein DICPUDRAFT_78657 [Dictyostelium purpureum]|eukprot:XP_003287809.1 hypothetical protein DICPUDRAFT_78657 [Dictyostelium purpureum]
MAKQKNQKFKISTGIRNNLAKYQESKIFREIVQNAEDAGANEVIIKLDLNTYGSNKLHFKDGHEFHSNLKDLQGPSIIIYNNGVFKDSDWEGIEYIGEGSKKKDMLSIGNFGLGFNSTYHITDCPQIISGKKLWFLDPLDLIGGGIEWEDFTAENYEEYEDQFKPFEQFGCTMKSYFKGTIIRLPLRLKKSEIKERPVSLEECKKILEEFYNEMLEIPIFLKVISSITLERSSSFIFKVRVKNHDQVQNERKKVSENLKTIVNNEMIDKTDNYEFNTIISKKNQNDFKSTYQLEMETTLNNNGVIKTNEISFIVSQGILVSNELNSLVIDSEIKLVSYGGVAIPITNNNGTIEVYDEEFQGKPFCFLPIGNQKISSKAHVFGYYILSDARSEIQYTGQSNLVSTQEYKINKWNHFVSESVVPFFYKEALNYMTKFNIDLISYFPYHCLVNKSSNSSAEIDFSTNTMKHVMEGNYFLNYFNRTGSQYNSYNGSVIVEENTKSFVLDYLRESNYQTILLNNLFISYLKNNGFNTSCIISPNFLCSLLSKNQLTEYSEDILDYICSNDSVITNRLLNNLQILPINHSNIRKLDSLQEKKPIYFSKYDFIIVSNNIYQLLNNIGANLDYILDISLISKTFCEKIDLIKKSYHNIKSIDIYSFLNKINMVADRETNYSKEIWEVIRSLYDFNDASINKSISKLHIFPYKEGQLSKFGFSNIKYINFNHPRVFPKSNSIFSENNRIIFEKLKIIFVENENCIVQMFLSNYCHSKSFIDKLYLEIGKHDSFEQILLPDEISSLRKYLYNLANQNGFTKWSNTNKNLFFSMPIHECIGNSNKKFTFISNQSTCIKFSDIKDYEINGKEVVLINSNEYDGIPLPTNSIYKNNFLVYLNYLLPNLQYFSEEKSIQVIKTFGNKYLYRSSYGTYNNSGVIYTPGSDSIYSNELYKSNWILTSSSQYINLKNVYHLSKKDIEIYEIIKPELVIHKEIYFISEILLNLQLIKNITICQTINSIIEFLQSNPCDQKLYDLLLIYFNQIDPSQANGTLDRIRNINFIPSYIVETYPGFEPNTSTISLSEVTILEHKDIKFSIKYPIKFENKSNIYNYLKDDSQSVFDHWYTLLIKKPFPKDLNLDIVFKSIYKFVSKIKELSPQQEQVLKQIKEYGILWHMNQFINIEKLYYEGENVVFSPFYYKVNPSVFPIFKKIIKENLYLEDYYNIISEIQKQEITQDLIQMYCYCLRFISNFNSDDINKDRIKLLPTIENQLIEFDKVVFSETAIPESIDYHQLNKLIALLTVDKLKISKLSQIIQEEVACSFGQKEELVPRLQSLIKDYGVQSFFNEMIQNSSDSNATEFKIFMDQNSYKSEYIKKEDVPDIENYLSNSLVIYNNSIFTDRDIENVQTISSSYKKQDQSTIGFNGLGINSAYNFSNVITILSGKYLMILDPFISHIPVSRSRSTGAKLEIKKHFNVKKDYFKPFLNYKKLFNIDFDQGEFKGTIIRLPLKKNLNKHRNIKNVEFNTQSILDLFSNFNQNQLHNFMFFTKISEIEIGYLTNKYESLYKTTKLSVKSLIQRETHKLLDVIPMDITEYTYEVINKKEKETKRFIVGSSTVFENNEEFLNNLPKDNKIRKFLTMYTEEKRKPYGGIAFEISDVDGSFIKQKSKSFCYLPFEDSDLPIHVNGFFSMTTARDILEKERAMNIQMNEDPLEKVVSKTTQSLESFSIYWNNLLIEELITPIFIKTLLLYKEDYILGREHPDKNTYMNLTERYYQIFPENQTNSSTIFQKFIHKFYQISIEHQFDYFIPHPNYCSRKSSVKFLCLIDSDQKPPMSTLKCFSNYGDIYFIPKKLCKQLELEQNIMKPQLLSKIIQNKTLDKEILNNNTSLIEIIGYLGPELSNGCQLLKLNNGTFDFVNRKKTLKFNQEYYNLFKDNVKISKDELYLDKEFSELVFYKTSSCPGVTKLNPIEFFFEIIFPNYESFTLEENISILNFFRESIYKNGKFTQLVNNQYDKFKGSRLIPCNFKDIPQFRSISELYSFQFKGIFDLPFPLECFDTKEWNKVFENFGIKNYLDRESIEREFKKLSIDYDSFKKDSKSAKDSKSEEKLVERSKSLWGLLKSNRDLINSFSEIFDYIKELNIIPTSSIDLIGAIPDPPLLGTIEECFFVQKHKNLLFTIKYQCSEQINPPNNYIQITNEIVFKNLFNIFQGQNNWKNNDNHIFDDKLFNLLKENCQYLEDQLIGGNQIKNINEYQIERLPIQNSNLSVEFENIIFENLQLEPFFKPLPNFYSIFSSLFTLLGVKTINNKQTIVNRLKQFLDHDITSQMQPFKIINGILSPYYDQTDKTVPILTNINFLKPLSKVFYIDNQMIFKRINIADKLWVANEIYKNEFEAWGIPKLSTLVNEEINKEISKFNQNFESSEFNIFNSGFLTDPELVTLISNHPNKEKFQNITINFGSIILKTILKTDNSNISNNKKTKYFYDPGTNSLYIDEDNDQLYSILEEIYRIQKNSLCSIFNRILAEGNKKETKKKKETIEQMFDLEKDKKTNDLEKDKKKTNQESLLFYQIALKKNQIATKMYQSQDYDEVFKYCNKSISFSVKSILEYQDIPYSSISKTNRLKGLTNSLNSLRELTLFETDLSRFKTSLCRDSNQANSSQILDLSNNYLKEAKKIINN